MEKSVSINYKGEEMVFNLEALEWGDTKKIRKKSIVIQEYNGEPMQFRDIDLMRDLKIVYSIKSVTKNGLEYAWEKTIDQLDKLSEKNRAALLLAVQELDNVSED